MAAPMRRARRARVKKFILRDLKRSVPLEQKDFKVRYLLSYQLTVGLNSENWMLNLCENGPFIPTLLPECPINVTWQSLHDICQLADTENYTAFIEFNQVKREQSHRVGRARQSKSITEIACMFNEFMLRREEGERVRERGKD